MESFMQHNVENYSLKREASNLCLQFLAMVYGPAPKKKVARETFFNYTELSYMVGVANTLMSTLEFLKRGQEAGWSLDELRGSMQVDLKKCWDELATHKVGHGAFRKLKLEDIIYANEPVDFVRKATTLPVKKEVKNNKKV